LKIISYTARSVQKETSFYRNEVYLEGGTPLYLSRIKYENGEIEPLWDIFKPTRTHYDSLEAVKRAVEDSQKLPNPRIFPDYDNVTYIEIVESHKYRDLPLNGDC